MYTDYSTEIENCVPIQISTACHYLEKVRIIRKIHAHFHTHTHAHKSRCAKILSLVLKLLCQFSGKEKRLSLTYPNFKHQSCFRLVSYKKLFIREDCLISRMVIGKRIFKLKFEVCLLPRSFSNNTLNFLLSKYLFFSRH